VTAPSATSWWAAEAPSRKARTSPPVANQCNSKSARWEPGQARAQAEGASLGSLMRAAVERYLAGELTSQALPTGQGGPELTSQQGPA
jgi:hypothetical protein